MLAISRKGHIKMISYTPSNGTATKVAQTQATERLAGPASVIQELVAQRNREIEEIEARRAEQSKATEKRGQKQLKNIVESLSRDEAGLLQKFTSAQTEFADEARASVSDIKVRLANAAVSAPVRETFAPSGLTTLFPYYLTLYNCSGGVIWQGANPGRATLWVDCKGSGSGIFGTGACGCTARAEWWYYHSTTESRWYSYTVNAPFRGFYIVYADDGFWDSKEAKAALDIDMIGYQYGYKQNVHANLLYDDSQNVNDNYRFDETATEYYGDLLGGPDFAYLRVTESLTVYARGDGSHGELNFADGTANYLDPPWIYVS
jgi:hypothetical protein